MGKGYRGKTFVPSVPSSTSVPYTGIMTTYRDAGVDIEAGNAASKQAYEHAMSTFEGRKGKIGAPVTEEGGFAGMLDMGDFYLIQNDDGTGSKMELAEAMNKFDTLGYDLVAMVADDAICMGAEVMSISNTLDVHTVDRQQVNSLLSGLAKACIKQRIVMPGGEIAEVPGAVKSAVWNATSVGVVQKDRVIDTGNIKEGDAVITLRSGVARSNGFSLIRKILKDAHGDSWHAIEWKNGTTWGDVLLTPSVIYHGALLSVIGRFDEKPTMHVKGMAHVTGGGIAENFRRTLKKTGLGAVLTDLFEPHDAIKDLVELGSVATVEAYRTWNMGNGMLVVINASDADAFVRAMKSQNIEAKQAGEITKEDRIELTAYTGEKITP